LLATYLNDNRQAWELDAHGVWTQRQPDGIARASHEVLVKNSWGIQSEAPPSLTARQQTAKTAGD
jgi:hypothetical protein